MCGRVLFNGCVKWIVLAEGEGGRESLVWLAVIVLSVVCVGVVGVLWLYLVGVFWLYVMGCCRYVRGRDALALCGGVAVW